MAQKDWSIDELQHIWQLASKLHDGQKYGGPKEGEKVEYINHIGSVVFEVINAARHTPDMNADLAVKCALLHDTLEDTVATFEQISELFGEEVAAGVLALTKSPAIEDKQQKMLDSLQRIKAQPVEIWAVKMADRICNLYQPPYYWDDAKKLAYISEAALIHETLQEGNAYLAVRLQEKMAAYHRYINQPL